MERRAFLQLSTAYVTAFGVGSFLLGQCQAAVAASGGRKLALLIGVDHYPQDSLKGCITDVALQEQLLVHRFGFEPADVVKLTNQSATLGAIKQAFGSTLRQLQPEDLLLIHFSGKGSSGPSQQPVLLLADDEPLMLRELARLLNACGTRRVITVLDTCYQGEGSAMRGNLRVRSPVASSTADVSNVAKAALPGVVLAAAAADQLAVEVDYPEFTAGRFTYGLTQALWQMADKILLSDRVLGVVSNDQVDRQRVSNVLPAAVMPPSIGAFLRLDRSGTAGTVWLGGMPAEKVATVNAQALLKSRDGRMLQVVSRQGLEASVRVKTMDVTTAPPLPSDSALSEQLRTIYRDLAVQIAIDHSLSKVERVDAVGALSGLPNVSTKMIGEGTADYILAKVQPPDPASHLVAALPDVPMQDIMPLPHYALFTADNQPISTTSVESSEAVKTMVKRFAPIIEALYVDKLMNLLENRDASNLAVTVEGDRLTPQAKLLFRQGTRVAQITNTDMATLPSVAAGTQLGYRVTNQSTTPLYWLILGWNSRHDTYVILPPVDQAAAVLAVGQTAELPLRASGVAWTVREPLGQTTVYLVTSDRPFAQTADTLKRLDVAMPEPYLHALTHPLAVIQAILRDLSVPDLRETDTYGFDMDRYAVIRLQYRVV